MLTTTNAEDKGQVQEEIAQREDKALLKMMLKDRLRIEENLDVQIQEMKEGNHPEEIVLVKVLWEEIEVVIFLKNQNKIKGTQITENVVMKDNNPNMSAKKTEIAGILVIKNP